MKNRYNKRYNNYGSRRNSNTLYRVTKTAGKFARSKLDINPFESYGKLPGHVYSKTVSSALDKAAYKANGLLGYRKGSNPALGSARYSLIRILFGRGIGKGISKITPRYLK